MSTNINYFLIPPRPKSMFFIGFMFILKNNIPLATFLTQNTAILRLMLCGRGRFGTIKYVK